MFENSPLKIKTADAAVSFRAGSFGANTATGPQAVTGVGFQPKAVLFYYASTTSETATTTKSSAFGMGFVASTSATQSFGAHERAVTYWAEHGAASDTGSGASITDAIVMTGFNGSTLGQAQLQSFDSDGFRLNWSTKNSQAQVIKYIAIGGTDITNATSSTFSLTTGTAPYQITVSGLGFQPDFVFFLPVSLLNSTTKRTMGTFTGVDAAFNLGFGVSTTTVGNASISVFAEDAETAAQNTRFQQAEAAIMTTLIDENNGSFVDALARLNSMTTDGFVIDVVKTPSAATDVFFLAIKGGQWTASSFNSATSPGAQTISGIPFQPVGLFMSTFGLASTTPKFSTGTASDDSHIAISAYDNGHGHGILSVDDDQDADMNQSQVSTSTKTVMMGVYSGANNTEILRFRNSASTTGFTSDGFSLDWLYADATARQVIFWAVGNSAVATAPTVTSNAATGVGVSSGTLNGNISATGGENATARGFAWGTNSALSGGDTSTTTESGSFGTGTFNQNLINLIANKVYYFRAYATNSGGTGYGSITSFTTSTNTIVSRKMRLFSGYRVKIVGSKLKLLQR